MSEPVRLLKDRLFRLLAFGAGSVTVGLLLLGLLLVAVKGLAAVSLEFLIRPMEQAGLAGGIRDQIVGTAIVVLTAAGLVLPCAFGVALLRSTYLTRPMAKRCVTLALYALNGIPSILVGVFGFFVFVKGLGWGKSWLAGGILLAMMILPTTALALSEGMDRIPTAYLEHARALGLTRAGVIWSVLVPQSLSSFASGVLLGLARAAGETAPIMFTATVFAGASLPRGIVDSPVLTLPYHIFNLAQDSYQPQAIQNAWASALVLILMVAAFSLCALPFRLRLHEEASH